MHVDRLGETVAWAGRYPNATTTTLSSEFGTYAYVGLYEHAERQKAQ